MRKHAGAEKCDREPVCRSAGGQHKKKKKKQDEDTEPKERGKTTPFDKIEVAGLYNEGLKAPEIANIIGSSTNTVYNILNKLRKEGKIE